MKILLYPGLDGGGELFEQFRRLLPTTLTTQVCPLPVDGDQQPRSLAGSIAATDLLNDSVIIIAESFSGRVVYELIQHHSNRIKGLILVSSFLTVPRPLLRLVRWFPLSLLPWHWSPAWVLRWFCVGSGASNELVRQVQRAIESAPRSTISKRINSMSELSTPCEKIRIPCLYLQPSNDRLVPKWHATIVRDLCEDLTVEVIPGPHFLLQANPEACVPPVVAFVDLVTKSGIGTRSAEASGDRCT